MKVLLFNTLYQPFKVGGAEISVQHLAEKFVELGMDVGVITLGKEDEELELNGVKIWRLKIENIFWPYEANGKSSLQKLKWHLKDAYNRAYKNKVTEVLNVFKPGIVHTNNLSGFSVSVWDLMKKKNIKIVHTLRDYYLICPKATRFKNGKTCLKQCLDCSVLSIIKKTASNKVDAVVGISDFILREHTDKELFKSAERHVIVNGFDIGKMKAVSQKFDENTYIKFGYIGQINKAKGVEVLLKSLSYHKNKENWELQVAGHVSKDYKSKLALTLPNDKLKFNGYMNSNVFFDNINVLIVPSIWEEPFGRVVLEGLIRGKIVLASDKGGLKELLKNNNHFSFSPEEEYLKDFLGNIINKPKLLNSFKHDVSHIESYSISKTARIYKDLFYHLAK